MGGGFRPGSAKTGSYDSRRAEAAGRRRASPGHSGSIGGLLSTLLARPQPVAPMAQERAAPTTESLLKAWGDARDRELDLAPSTTTYPSSDYPTGPTAETSVETSGQTGSDDAGPSREMGLV